MAKALRNLRLCTLGQSRFARRISILTWLATSLSPIGYGWADDAVAIIGPSAVVHAVGGESDNPQSTIVQVVGKQPEPRKASPSRSLLQNGTSSRPAAKQESRPEPQSPHSYVAPAGGGLLENWFGNQTSTPKAKKEHEDGRTATALPPPDPNSVDWQGLPVHQPHRSTAAVAPAQPEPMRDFQRGSVAAPNSPQVPAIPVPLRRAVVGSGVPSRPVSSSVRPNVTSLAPLQTRSVAPSPSRSVPDLSDTNSTRRNGRRPIEALDVEEFIVSPTDIVQPEPRVVSMSEPTPIPSVPRRAIAPVDALSSTTTSATPVETNETADLPPLPKSAAVKPVTAPSPAPTPAAEPSVLTVPAPVADSSNNEDNWVAKPVPKPVPSVVIGSGVPAAESRPETTPAAPTSSPTLAPVPALVAATPIAPAPPIAAPVVNAELAERQLRERLLGEAGTIPRKSESSPKQLGASELPGVRVVTEGPSEIMIRELSQYEVRVENRGSFDATGVIVRSSLPGWAEIQGHNASLGEIKTVDQNGAKQLQWTIDKLPAGVVERLFVRVKATRSGTFDVATEWTLMPQTHVASVKVREPKLAIVIDGPDEIVYGRSEKYRVRVMNPGDGDASNVAFTLAPQSSSPQTQQIGIIPAGKEAEFEIEITAREQGSLKIGGVATADREVRTNVNKDVRIAAANVVAELTGPPLKYQNAEAVYHLYVANNGKAVCESMNAELRLPLGVKYLRGIDQASAQADRVAWKIDSMQPGATREYDIVCRLDRTGDLVLAFNCNGSAAGQASVSIETRVEAIADLVLSISDPVAPAPVATEVMYEIVVTNRGSKAAEEVRVVAQFSHGIEPLRVEGQAGEMVPGQVLFSPIKRIEPGATIRLKVAAKAEHAGDHRFRTEVRHGETSLVSEEATMFMMAPAERISRRSTDK